MDKTATRGYSARTSRKGRSRVKGARGRGVHGATTSEGAELCVFLTGGERAVGRYSFAIERNDTKNGVAGGRN